MDKFIVRSKKRKAEELNDNDSDMAGM